MLNEHSSANLVCLTNGFVKNCLASIHGECEQTNHHTVIGAEQTSFDVRSIYQHPREHYRVWMKVFAIARSCLLYHPYPHIKPCLHQNANRIGTWTLHSKTMRTFDVDVFLRRGKQHSTVWWTFGKQPNAIRQISILQKKFAYDTFRCRRHFFFTFGNDGFPGNNWEQGLFAASANAEQCTNLLHKRTHRFRMPRSRSRSVRIPMQTRL